MCKSSVHPVKLIINHEMHFLQLGVIVCQYTTNTCIDKYVERIVARIFFEYREKLLNSIT